MSLNQYQKKRNFSKTPEPKGTITHERPRLFVIQKHAASHLHYDFRIELNGVLKSWAIPKGPSLDPKVKRLAMHVEDHPVEYGTFEGIIPQGQYGGGTVMLWDSGTWSPLDDSPQLALEKGHLRFELHAEKLHGRWDLIRFKDDKHWFLIKHQDEYAQDEDFYSLTEELNKSVLSQQTIEEITHNYARIWTSDKSKSQKPPLQNSPKNKAVLLPKNLSKSVFPSIIQPQLATLVDKPPEGDQWLHEIKFDGYRILAFKNKSEVCLKSRNNNDWSERFLSITEALQTLPFANVILDGEVVVLDSGGKSDFQLLQNSLKMQIQNSFVYYIFDILYFDKYDLKNLPLIERKSILKEVLIQQNNALQYSDHILEKGNQMYEHACKFTLEGIISKRVDSVYLSKRNKDWLKIKCLNRQEFVIGGYTPPKGNRAFFGSLFLGVYNKDGTLDFAGNVGTGFSDETLKEIHRQLILHKSTVNPFNSNPPGYTQAHWVLPQLVGEVEFTQWTKDDHLRHPSFKGLRLDKKASAVQREQKTTIAEVKMKSSKKHKRSSQITHPDKVLYAEDTITKEDLLNYYEFISAYILPYIINRPLTLVRCPSDYHQCFYQRHFNKSTPQSLHSLEINTANEMDNYMYLNDKEGLLSLVQMGVLEIHPWGSRIDHLEQPDIIVIDLDPAPDVPWSRVVAAALEIKEHLEQFKLTSFVKSTGGKGLHVVIPIKAQYDWDEVKNFTHVFVQFLEKLKPKEYISTMSKTKRMGKIFIDYLRNQRTATAIGTYSTRARIHAPVSTPLAWDELSDSIDDNSYTIKTLPQRLKKLKEDPWNDFWKIKQSLRLDEL
jgi:bifunctional non-homologous end joining protein LigD